MPPFESLTPLLMVYDMQRSVEFYCDLLGFEVVAKHDPDGKLYWVLLRMGKAELMLNAEFEDEHRPSQPPPRSSRGMVLYIACADADDVYQHLLSKGFEAKPPKTAYYGMKQLEIRDPDGFEICLQNPV
jgi:uncharacterized glyoxalase superfamily protein PhnB